MAFSNAEDPNKFTSIGVYAEIKFENIETTNTSTKQSSQTTAITSSSSVVNAKTENVTNNVESTKSIASFISDSWNNSSSFINFGYGLATATLSSTATNNNGEEVDSSQLMPAISE